MANAEETKVKLHWLNGSRSQGTLFLLEALQVPYELQIYRRLKSLLAPPEMEKIHPFGKSPIVTIEVPGAAEPLVLAESAFIVQYLSDHYGGENSLLPKRWKDGQEGKVGGETEEWMRYQYLMYAAEGSFMASLAQYYLFSALKSEQVPFFIRPITRLVVNQVIGTLIFPTIQKQMALLEKYLQTAPENGQYLCGPRLTGADVMFAYALIGGKDGVYDGMGKWSKGSFRDTHPALQAYIERLATEPAWLRSVEKIKEIEGSFSVLP